MSFVRNVSKSVLFAVAIACVTTGTELIETELYAGIILIIVGVVLIIIYAYLLEKQTVDASVKTLRRGLRKDERERDR